MTGRIAAFRYTRRSGYLRNLSAIFAMVFCVGLLAAGCTPTYVAKTDDAVKVPDMRTRPEKVVEPKRANFKGENASRDIRDFADWVIDSGDNGGKPFLIIDKTDARVFLFGADGNLRGVAPALLGLAKGDDTIPGIGNKKLSAIRPEERTTPAGRFVASLGRNAKGKEILWIDYDIALSLHPVVPVKARLQRLDTPTPDDNRISYGCVNVPVKFYDGMVSPVFRGSSRGIVYILPETRSKTQVFSSYYNVDSRSKQALGPIE